MCKILLSAKVFPTEDRAKIVAALVRLFPDVTIEGEETILGRSSSLDTFSEQLAKQRIRAAARKILLRGIEGSQTSFRLNKQVATMGKISFSEEDHPLGDIEVTIQSEDPMSVIDKMAPSMKEDGS